MLDIFNAFVGLLVLAGLGILVFVKKILDKHGTISAVFVGFLVLFMGGWEWLILLLVFLTTAAIATRYRYEQKSRLGFVEGQTDIRSWRNVFANSAISVASAVVFGATSLELSSFAFLGAISVSMADTLATEFGLLNPFQPRLITNLSKRVPAGTSGGVSPYGMLASLVGSGIISLVAMLLGFGHFMSSTTLISTFVGGFSGSLFDSFLGATVQARFKCQVCGKVVEKRTHCGRKANHSSGLSIMGNNFVNFISSLFGAMIAVFFRFSLNG
jgi:uncharacterized protein (TIGR00297 family)